MDNSGVCVHQALSDPLFVWNSGYNQVVDCTPNGEITVLPCANSNCNFEVANCVNNADESGFECECKYEFPNCNTATTSTQAPTTTTEPSCNLIQEGSGTVTSPGFPNNYENYENCTYTLIADEGKTIRITFDSFTVEDCSSCDCDALTILENRYCGEDFGNGTIGSPPSRTIDIDQESAVLTWTTDFSVTRTGFNFTWESVGPEGCEATINDSTVSCNRGNMIIEVPVCALEENNINPNGVYMGKNASFNSS